MSKNVFKVHIRAPIDKVWKTLTNTNDILPFFFNSRCETPGLAPGAPIRMRTPNGKYTGVVGEVIDFEPPYRYSHTFKFTSLDDPPCKVTYLLREVEDGVEFTLINEEVPAGTKTEKYMTQGGQFIVDNLKALIETGKPTLGGCLILLMCKLSEPFTPKAALSVNWPLTQSAPE